MLYVSTYRSMTYAVTVHGIDDVMLRSVVARNRGKIQSGTEKFQRGGQRVLEVTGAVSGLFRWRVSSTGSMPRMLSPPIY
jgi:hypothetical protein